MSLLTSKQLDEIRARANAATPGPYDFLLDPNDATFRVVEVDGYGGTIRLVAIIPAEHNWANAERNAVFLAGAPVDIAALLSHADALQVEIEVLRESRNGTRSSALRPTRT